MEQGVRRRRADLSETVVALRTTIDGEYVSTELPTIVTLQRDETRKVIELATVHDSVLIENGSVTIELLPDTTGEDKNARGKYSTYPYWKGHTPAGKRSDQATVTISNIDTFPGVFISDTRVAEDAGTVTLSVKLTSAYSEDARVSWGTEDGTATAGEDYVGILGVVAFSPDQTENTISITITDDTLTSIYEGDETLRIVLSGPVKAAFRGGADSMQAMVTIEDNDLPKVTVAAKEDGVEEVKPAVFVLTRNGHLGEVLDVSVLHSTPDSQSRVDASFGAGNATTEVSFSTTDDEIVNGSFVTWHDVALHGDGGLGPEDDVVWTSGDPSEARVTVVDNDRLQLISVRAKNPRVEEGQPAVFVLTRYGLAISKELEISFQYDDPDTNESRSATFTAGSDTVEVSYTTSDEDKINTATEDRTWAINLYGDGGEGGTHELWQALYPDSASVVVYDNDADHAMSLVASAPLTAETGETVTVTFNVTNSGKMATGDKISVGTDRAGFTGCDISGLLSPGSSAECSDSFVVTTADKQASPIVISATANDGATTSNSFAIRIKIVETPTVGMPCPRSGGRRRHGCTEGLAQQGYR